MQSENTTNFVLKIITHKTKEFSEYIQTNPNHLLNVTSAQHLVDIFEEIKKKNDKVLFLNICNIKNDRNENIFHSLAIKNGVKEAKTLISFMNDLMVTPATIAELLMSQNKANNSPLMSFIKNNAEQDYLLELWNICEQELENIPSHDILSHNSRQETILHLCGEAGHYELFEKICFSENIQKEDIKIILNSTKTPLQTIKCNFEDLLQKLQDFIDWAILEDFSDCQKMILWHVCKNNFNNVFHFIKGRMKHKKFLDFIMVEDENGNNASMLAAMNSSDMVLMSLMSIITYGTNDNELMDRYLHGTNNKGESLLKLVISHELSLSIQRDILIKAERDFHRSEGNYTLVKCFKDKIGPHFIIEKAITEERVYVGKISCPSIRPWILAFFPFFIPFVLYTMDIITDSFLVKYYYDERENQLDLLNCGMYSNVNQTLKCSLDESILRKLKCIPLGLPANVCFNYSLAFLLFPMITYVLEWYYSKYEKLSKSVKYNHFSELTTFIIT